MITKQVETEYRKARKPYLSGRYGPFNTRASYCLSYAKRKVWCHHNWTEDCHGNMTTIDGKFRLKIVPDEHLCEDDLFGDTFDIEMHKDTVPGGERTIKAQYKAAVERVERDGVWGLILEKQCPNCASWEHVESCFGFECEVPEDEIINFQYLAKEA